MTATNNTGTTAGRAAAPAFPILGILGIAFVVLKLCEVIGWSWWWVTVPFWGPFALLAAIFLGGVGAVSIVALIKALVEQYRKGRKA